MRERGGTRRCCLNRVRDHGRRLYTHTVMTATTGPADQGDADRPAGTKAPAGTYTSSVTISVVPDP
jgi:hypothetical protein